MNAFTKTNTKATNKTNNNKSAEETLKEELMNEQAESTESAPSKFTLKKVLVATATLAAVGAAAYFFGPKVAGYLGEDNLAKLTDTIAEVKIDSEKLL